MLLQLQLAQAVVDCHIIYGALWLALVDVHRRRVLHPHALPFLPELFDRRESVHGLRVLHVDLALSIHLARKILRIRGEALAVVLASVALWSPPFAWVADSVTAWSLVRFDSHLEVLLFNAGIPLVVVHLDHFRTLDRRSVAVDSLRLAYRSGGEVFSDRIFPVVVVIVVLQKHSSVGRSHVFECLAADHLRLAAHTSS